MAVSQNRGVRDNRNTEIERRLLIEEARIDAEANWLSADTRVRRGELSPSEAASVEVTASVFHEIADNARGGRNAR